MSITLYPTPTRLRLMRDIDEGHVTAVREPTGIAAATDGWSYWLPGGPNVSARVHELTLAGWVKRSAPITADLWAVSLTVKGSAVAESPNPAQEAAR